MSDINETTRQMLRSTALAIAERDQVPPSILHVISARDLLLGALMQEYNSLIVSGLTVEVEPPTSQLTPEQPAEILVGSDLLPSPVEIAAGQTMTLGEIVAHAHAKSGLSVDEWNALPSDERDALLQSAIDKLKAATEPEAPIPAAGSKEPETAPTGSVADAGSSEAQAAADDASASRRKRGNA